MTLRCKQGFVVMTLQEKMLQQVVNERCAVEADWVQIVSQVLRRLQTQYWTQEYVDSFMQKWDRFEYDIYDAYSFAQFHAAVNAGKIAHATIQLSGIPKSDHRKSANNKLLEGLRPPFVAQFTGGSVDDDGTFLWDHSIELVKSTSDNMMSVERVVVPSGRVPLEVGYTTGSRTLLHLAQERGVARWPYGSCLIYLYLTIDGDLWSPSIAAPHMV